MRRELEVMASISLRTGRRVNRIEREYAGVAERIESVELRGPARCFDQAIDFARRGTDPGKLTQQFGLSRAEADLVTRLHGRRCRHSAMGSHLCGKRTAHRWRHEASVTVARRPGRDWMRLFRLCSQCLHPGCSASARRTELRFGSTATICIMTIRAAACRSSSGEPNSRPRRPETVLL